MAQRRKTLKEETIDLLRASNTKLEQELSASRRHVREVENLNVELAMKCGGTEQQDQSPVQRSEYSLPRGREQHSCWQEGETRSS
jgi:hypothetical protein